MAGQHKATEKQVKALQSKCGLPAARCRAALKKHGPVVDRTLAALIDAGTVRVSHLDPFLCSKALFERAQRVARRLDARVPSRTGRYEEPPFPRLTFEGTRWTGRDVLPGWAGFQDRRGAYTSRVSRKASSGKVNVSVAAPGDEETDPPPTPSKQQAAAYAYLKADDARIAQAVLRAVFKEYPRLRDSYGLDDEEAEEYMPEIKRPEELRRLLGLGTVHVLSVVKGTRAYVGLELGCTWDEEHGLGVMTHGTRVVSVGDASISFQRHDAEADGGKDLAGP